MYFGAGLTRDIGFGITEQGQAKEGNPPRRHDRGRPLPRCAHRRRRVDLLPLGGRGHRGARRAGQADEGEAGQRVLVRTSPAERASDERLRAVERARRRMLAAGATCAVWQPTPINGAAERARICFVSILEIDGRLSSGTNPQSFPSRYNKACDAYAIQFFFRILAGIHKRMAVCLSDRMDF